MASVLDFPGLFSCPRRVTVVVTTVRFGLVTGLHEREHSSLLERNPQGDKDGLLSAVKGIHIKAKAKRS